MIYGTPAHPVFGFACPALEALLQSVSHATRPEELLHELPSVRHLLFADQRLERCQIPRACLLKRRNGQLWQTLLMDQCPVRNLNNRHWSW